MRGRLGCGSRRVDGEFIGHLGELGQVFAEAHAGHVGFDLLELAAVRIGRIRLEIKVSM